MAATKIKNFKVKLKEILDLVTRSEKVQKSKRTFRLAQREIPQQGYMDRLDLKTVEKTANRKKRCASAQAEKHSSQSIVR